MIKLHPGNNKKYGITNVITGQIKQDIQDFKLFLKYMEVTEA